jgi:hypothetical protein
VVQTTQVALESLEIGGTLVQAGKVMTVSLLVAGHDAVRHSNPLRFDVERADASRFALVAVRISVLDRRLPALRRIAIPLLFERFPGLRLDPQHAIEHKGVPVFNGLTELWVRAT